jgi:hypothetical protein
MVVIYSGLDWSGSPGNAHGPWLVIAISHVDEADISTLDTELAQARARLRVAPDFVFHHSDASDRTKAEFFAALQRAPVTAHVYMLNKSAWSAQYVTGSSGTDCILDGIIRLIASCPPHCVNEQMLYIDLQRREVEVVKRYRTTIRQALRRAKQPAFRDMKPRPDDQNDAALIQVADMVAGEVREHSGINGPYLPAHRHQITIV